MAHTLSGPNIEEEYMWSVTLDKDTKEYSWNPKDPSDKDEEEEDEEELDPSVKPNHRLLVKSAILHPEAKEGEITLVQVQTKGYQDTKVVTPFVAMKAGVDLQRYVDILVPDSATLKLVSGSGPITLVGSHCVDFYDYRNYGHEEDDDDEEDAESSEDDELDAEEQEAVAVKEDKAEDKKKSAAVVEKSSPAKSPTKKAGKEKSTPVKAAEKEGEKVTPGKEGKKGTPGKEGKKRKASEESPEKAADKGDKKKRKGSGDK